MKIEDIINKIHQADCLVMMKNIPDKSVDLVLTDPPYGIDIGKMNFTNSTKGGVAVRNDYKGMADWDKHTPTKEVFNEIRRVSKNQIIFGGQYFTEMLPSSGSWLVWDKRVEEKYSNDFADVELAWTSFIKPSRIFRFLWSGMMQGDMKNKEMRFHPTQKPVKLFANIINDYSVEGGVILDPFLGSGTTAVAAKQLKRNFIGIEISENYCKIARDRLRQELLF